MNYTFDSNVISDLHKDARGFRPRGLFWERWDEASDAEKQAIWDGLCRELESEMERECRLQIDNQRALEARIASAMEAGAPTREDAIRWVVQGEGEEDSWGYHDGGYLSYHFGIDYTVGRMYFN